MSVIPVIASAADLDAAVKFANRNRSARWYVARRAEALGTPDLIPASWGMARPGLVAAFSGNWSDASREKAAGKGVAMKDGSYPIKDKADLQRAIQAFGRAKKGDKEAVRKHIIERARALGARNILPESWHGAMTASLRQVLGQGSIEVSEALLDDAIERGLAVQVGVRADGAILYDLEPENEADLTALAAAFYTADDLTGSPDFESEPTHAGLAVQAADTGRVLMLQRALDPEDPAAGKWEFPGGGIDDDDASPFDGACREFCEETGLGVPDGENAGQWTSPNGIYRGHLLRVPTESDAFDAINPDVEAAHNIDNPDDPHRENPEVTAWMHPDDLQGNPAVRAEVLESTPWELFDSEASDGVDSDAGLEPDPTDSEEEQEPLEVDEKYRALAAAANGCHSLNLPYPEDLQGVAYVLLRDLEGDYNTPLFASGFTDWEEHPDAVAPSRASQYEAIVACAEEAGMTAGAVLKLKAAQKRLGWAAAEQLSEVIAGDLLENHPTSMLESIRDFLKPHAPLLASAINEYLNPVVASWNPNLHPRDRDGQFLEVGDIVNVFDGLNFDTPSFQGKITGNHTGSDGKVMVAVTDSNNVMHAVDPAKIKAAPEHKANLDGPNGPDAGVTQQGQGMTYQDDHPTHPHVAVDQAGNQTRHATEGEASDAAAGGAPAAQTREEKQAARQAKNEADFPVGTKVSQTVHGINGKEDLVHGTVSGHKGGAINVDTPSHGTLSSEPGKLTKVDEPAAPAAPASPPSKSEMQDYLLSKGYDQDVVDSLTDDELTNDFIGEGGQGAEEPTHYTDRLEDVSGAPGVQVDHGPDGNGPIDVYKDGQKVGSVEEVDDGQSVRWKNDNGNVFDGWDEAAKDQAGDDLGAIQDMSTHDLEREFAAVTAPDWSGSEDYKNAIVDAFDNAGLVDPNVADDPIDSLSPAAHHVFAVASSDMQTTDPAWEPIPDAFAKLSDQDKADIAKIDPSGLGELQKGIVDQARQETGAPDAPLQNPDGSLARIPNPGEVPDISGMNPDQKQALRDRVLNSNMAKQLATAPSDQGYRNSRDKRLEALSGKSPEEISKAADQADVAAASYAKVYGETDPITVRAHQEAQMMREMATATPPNTPDAPAGADPKQALRDKVGAPANVPTQTDAPGGKTPSFDPPRKQKDKIGRPLETGSVVTNQGVRGTVLGQTPDRRTQVMVRKDDGSIQSWYSDSTMLESGPGSPVPVDKPKSSLRDFMNEGGGDPSTKNPQGGEAKNSIYDSVTDNQRKQIDQLTPEQRDAYYNARFGRGETSRKEAHAKAIVEAKRVKSVKAAEKAGQTNSAAGSVDWKQYADERKAFVDQYIKDHGLTRSKAAGIEAANAFHAGPGKKYADHFSKSGYSGGAP